MSTKAILALQSLLITMQIVNAGIASVTHNLLVALVLGAIVGGLQNFVQHIGNQTDPNARQNGDPGQPNAGK